MPRRVEEIPHLEIDTSPRGPLRLGARHRSLVSSGRFLSWSRAFWGTLGAIGTFVLWCVAGAAFEAVTGPSEPRRLPESSRVMERYREQREAGRERQRQHAEEEEEERVRRVERLGSKLDSLSPDRRLWVAATPEDMALTWARRVRPGTYRIRSARKLMAVLIATLEEAETGQAFGLRADMNPDYTEAVVRLTEMRPAP
jgi:hypothetical protein